MVPQEIILQIIDFLDGDAAALKACSLLSSSFRAHSQRHLFHTVTLDLSEPSQQDLLHQAFTSNPGLSDLVLHLQLLLAQSPVDAVCDVLRQLHNVCGVTLLPTNQYPDETSWMELHIQLRDFLARIICLPTCQSLYIGNDIYLPLNFVSQLSHLRHLQFSHRSSFLIFGDAGDPMEFSLQSPNEGFLESLTVGQPFMTMEGALFPSFVKLLSYPAPLSISRLRVCHISHMSQSDDLQDLFNACPLLERIHLNIMSPPDLDFSSLTYLRVVCINAAGGFAPGAWLIRILASLPFASHLELLALSGRESLITRQQWFEIDHLLTQEGDHITEISPRVVWYPRDLQPEYWHSFEEKLPRLAEKGMLVLATNSIEQSWDGSSVLSPTWSKCSTCFLPP